MSTITLREYHALINTLIEKNANDEAIFHCTNILTNYPKDATTYQQLGQALLEKKRFEDAANVFSMVLSVFPDDFMAHAGLSEIHEENRELDKAIWHMEQAFETQPSNQTIQDELRRLIGKRDGSEPSKIRLTRGALIRMYAKGELYQQAIAETQSALQAYPDRVDLKLLLAKLLVLTNNPTEAGEICGDILVGSPYCFEANRIMFEITSTSTDVENYDPIYHQRLSDLNPYYAFIETATTRIEDVPDDKITLDKAEYIPSDNELTNTPEWASRIGIPWNEESTTISAKESVGDIPDSLFSDDELIEESALSTPFISDNDDSIIEEPFGNEEIVDSVDENLPDWISKAGWIRASEEEAPPPPADLEEPTPDVEAVADTFAATPAEDLPDWLQSLNPEGSDAPQIFASDEQESIPEAAIPPLPPEILSEFLSGENEESEVYTPKVTDNLSNQQEPALPEYEKPSDFPLSTNGESISDLPDWLKDLDSAEFTVSTPDESSVLPEAVSELTETVEKLETSTIPSADFIEELETSDLIGELETVSDEDTDKSEVNDNVEIETSGMKPQQETVDEPLEKVLFEDSITEEVAKTEEKTSIPAWVKNILSTTSIETPIISPAPSTDLEIPTQVVRDEPITDENIEELITDLPEASDLDGAISEEVTGELDSWLNEMSTEEEPATAPVAAVFEEPVKSEDETSAISLEALSEPLSEDEIEPVLPDEIEIETESILEATEYTSFDDRLSSMLVTEEEKEVISFGEETVAVEQDAVHIPDLATLTSELQTGDYASLAKDMNYKDLPEEIFDQLLPELNSVLEKNPSNSLLWQTLGDIHSKKSNISDAIKAYQEAEKLLLQ